MKRKRAEAAEAKVPMGPDGGSFTTTGTSEEEKPQTPSPIHQPLFAIGGAITALVGVLGALVFTGTLERLPRNHPFWASVAFVLVVLAAGGWTMATLFRDSEEGRARSLRRWGVASYIVGLGIVVVAIFATYSQDEQPSISATYDLSEGLAAQVNVGRLSSNDYVTVTVHGLYRDPDDLERWVARRLYNATTGPDAAGAVSHEIDMPIATGTYEILRIRAATSDDRTLCAPMELGNDGVLVDPDSLQEARKPKTGCLFLTLPRFARVPSLDAVVEPDQNHLKVTVSAENTPYRALLRVATKGVGRVRPVLRELLMPDALGDLSYVRRLPISDGTRTVCIVAQWYRSGDELHDDACPTVADNETVWSMIQLSGENR
jgi:hypothetical protein